MTLPCNISLISNCLWHRSTRNISRLPMGKRSGNGVSILIWIRPVLPARNQYWLENRKIIFIGDWTESLSVADSVCSTGSKTISFWSWYQQKSAKLILCPICSALLQYSFPEFVYFLHPACSCDASIQVRIVPLTHNACTFCTNANSQRTD